MSSAGCGAGTGQAAQRCLTRGVHVDFGTGVVGFEEGSGTPCPPFREGLSLAWTLPALCTTSRDSRGPCMGILMPSQVTEAGCL